MISGEGYNPELKYVRIYFDTATFDTIKKDTSAKIVDILSAIGGTMGLLTGFSIISVVEIVYFAVQLREAFKKKTTKHMGISIC